MAWQAWEKAVVNALCISSVIGIWPRFLEPRWVRHRAMKLPLRGWTGRPLSVVHLSDLHWGPDALSRSSREALRRAAQSQPDLVLWTGDYLVDAEPYAMDQLEELMSLCRGRLGTFASLGNHDYSKYVSFDGDTWVHHTRGSRLARILKRICHAAPPPPPPLQERLLEQGALVELFQSTGIQLLHNRSVEIEIEGSRLEIGGTGDLWAGACVPLRPRLPASLLLCHNPDGLMGQESYWSGMLAGHTHGRQVNLPGLALRLAQAQGPYTRGLYPLSDSRWVHVTSGLGCALPFRFFSPPEIVRMTLLPEFPERRRS